MNKFLSQSSSEFSSFSSMGLSEPLIHSLEKMKFLEPTPIQSQAIPIALEGKDILGSAQTGTGKTGAFGIPLVNKLLTNSRGSALVMTPTRELAVQVMQALEAMLGKDALIKTALLIGGEAIPRQFKQLSRRPRLIVGTPGRINDHLTRGTLKLHDTEFLVLDETDRMLDMGFSVQIEKILKYMKKEHQTLLFSATLPKNIVSMANKYLNDPVRISVGSTSAPLEKIKQEIVNVSDSEKYNVLKSALDKREGSVLIFVKTKRGADKMAIRLRREDYKVDAIHGDLRQNKRDQVVRAFRNQKFRIMVATDVAARGLDIPHIEHVINYDLPQCPEDYVHRVGRTARGGAEGQALCLVSPADKKKWRAINNLINPDSQMEAGVPSKKKSRIDKFHKRKNNKYKNNKGKNATYSKRSSASNKGDDLNTDGKKPNNSGNKAKSSNKNDTTKKSTVRPFSFKKHNRNKKNDDVVKMSGAYANKVA